MLTIEVIRNRVGAVEGVLDCYFDLKWLPLLSGCPHPSPHSRSALLVGPFGAHQPPGNAGSMRILIAYLASLATFLVLDTAWLTLVAIDQFQRLIGPIMLPRPNLLAAAAFYVIFAAGLVFLAVRPALQHHSMAIAASHGAVVGLTAYATFDLTNLAIIKGWTLGLAVLDMAWGSALSATAATAGYLAAAKRAEA